VAVAFRLLHILYFIFHSSSKKLKRYSLYIHFSNILLYIEFICIWSILSYTSSDTYIIAMSESSVNEYRQLVPGPSPSDDGHESEHSPPEKGTWKKRVSTACLACKKSKRKVCPAIHLSFYTFIHGYLHLCTKGILYSLSTHIYTPQPDNLDYMTNTPPPVQWNIPLHKLPNLQKNLHLRRIPRPTPPRRRKTHSNRTNLPPRPLSRPLQTNPRSKRVPRTAFARYNPPKCPSR
jgi:hypothetical protein